MFSKKFFRAAVLLFALSILGKMLGFLKESLMAAYFGTSAAADAFYIASMIPILVFSMVTASLNTNLIPVTLEWRERHGQAGTNRSLNNLIGVLTLVTVLFVLLGWLGAPWLVTLIGPGLTGETRELAISLTQVLFLSLPFTGIATVLTSVYQAEKKFSLPSLVLMTQSLFVVLAVWLFSGRFDIYAVAGATVLSAVVQLAILAWYTKTTGYRLGWGGDWRDPFLKKMWWLSLPVIISTGPLQISMAIDRMFASQLPHGSIAAMNYANSLNQLPIAIFIASFITIIYPSLAEFAAKRQMDEYKKSFKQGVSIILFFFLPIAVVFIAYGGEIISLLYQRGEFDHQSAEMTYEALFYFTLGLVPMALRELFNKAFYCLQNTKTPMMIGIAAICSNILFNFLLVGPLGLGGLALSITLASFVQVILLYLYLRRAVEGVSLPYGSILKILLAGGVMWGVFLLCQQVLPAGILPAFAGMGIGAAAYLAALLLLRFEEMRFLVAKLARRR